MSNEAAYDLLAAKLEEAKAYHVRELNRQLFAVGVSRPVRPLTLRERLSRRLARVRGYFSVLWDALRGRDLYERDDYDY
jgi:hypothetical protein